MLKFLKKQKELILAPIGNLTDADKINFLVLTLMYALVLFTYPMIRSVTEATILEELGMRNWNMANFYSILTLVVVVNLYNFWQKKIGQKKIFIITAAFSAFVFSALSIGLESFGKFAVYTLFVWKEVYIVLLVHICLGFFNTHFSEDFAKSFFGVFGALTSIGSISGGLITSNFSRELGSQSLMFISCGILIFTLLIASRFNERIEDLKVKEHKKPMSELSGLWGYVFLILSIVALSQFLIYIINLNFNSFVKMTIESVDAKTEFFGRTYTYVNLLALGIQFILTPLALKNLKLKTNHFAVIAVYLLVFAPLIAFGGGSLTVLSMLFISAKAVDYSFFGTIKEMLYYPLTVGQKYAAKYIVDMFGYRFSKAVVALFFANFFAPNLAKWLFLGFSGFWLLAILKIFSINNTLYSSKVN